MSLSSMFYYIDTAGKVQGPYALKEIREVRRVGAITDETLVAGALVMFGFGLLYETLVVSEESARYTTSTAPEHRVTNLRKLNDRECGAMIGGVLTVVGAIFVTGGGRR